MLIKLNFGVLERLKPGKKNMGHASWLDESKNCHVLLSVSLCLFVCLFVCVCLSAISHIFALNTVQTSINCIGLPSDGFHYSTLTWMQPTVAVAYSSQQCRGLPTITLTTMSSWLSLLPLDFIHSFSLLRVYLSS